MSDICVNKTTESMYIKFRERFRKPQHTERQQSAEIINFLTELHVKCEKRRDNCLRKLNDTGVFRLDMNTKIEELLESKAMVREVKGLLDAIWMRAASVSQFGGEIDRENVTPSDISKCAHEHLIMESMRRLHSDMTGETNSSPWYIARLQAKSRLAHELFNMRG